MPSCRFSCCRIQPQQYAQENAKRLSLLVLAPPPCQSALSNSITLPAGMVAVTASYSLPYSGEEAYLWLPGRIRVAPLALVKSDNAQIALSVIGRCGRGSGINWVSSWIGCASWPGPSTSEQNDDSRHSLSSTRSTTASTLACSGTCQNMPS